MARMKEARKLLRRAAGEINIGRSADSGVASIAKERRSAQRRALIRLTPRSLWLFGLVEPACLCFARIGRTSSRRGPPVCHRPDLCGETVLEAGAISPPTGAGDWRLAVKNCAPSRRAIRVTKRMVWDLAAAGPSGVGARKALLVALPRGKSAINRAATDAESGCADGLSGSAAINEAILSVAVSSGI
ncbi:MAG: hypothetical protein ACLQE9_05500 [Roseiarcus sp.]